MMVLMQGNDDTGSNLAAVVRKKNIPGAPAGDLWGRRQVFFQRLFFDNLKISHPFRNPNLGQKTVQKMGAEHGLQIFPSEAKGDEVNVGSKLKPVDKLHDQIFKRFG